MRKGATERLRGSGGPSTRAFQIAFVVAIPVIAAAGYWLHKNRGASIHRTEVVEVLSTAGGSRDKISGQFVHRVRLQSGDELRLTFDRLYASGDLVKVDYSRNLRWGFDRRALPRSL